MNESNQAIVIKEPNMQTVNTIIALVLVHGITHVNAKDTAIKKKNDAAVINSAYCSGNDGIVGNGSYFNLITAVELIIFNCSWSL